MSVASVVGGLVVAALTLGVRADGPQSFQTLASGYTQALVGTTQMPDFSPDLPMGLGGIAFAPGGDLWVADCVFTGTRLHRFALSAPPLAPFHGTATLHAETAVVSTSGGCGLTNWADVAHGQASLFSNSSQGVYELNPSTGAVIRGPLGPAGNALGIAVDPQTNHVVYAGADCHPTLINPLPSTCTLWDLDPAQTDGHPTRWAQTTHARLPFVDGLYFSPTGSHLFVANRVEDNFQNFLSVLKRPTTPLAGNAQIAQDILMTAEPDGVAFHDASDPFVVTNDEFDGTQNVGTMTRFDFPGGFEAAPAPAVPATPGLQAYETRFANGGFRGDLTQVGPDGCIYATQGRFFVDDGFGDPGHGTRYDDGTETTEDGIVKICGVAGGFLPPPGVPETVSGGGATLGSIAGSVYLDTNGNHAIDAGDSFLASVPVTLSGTTPGSTTSGAGPAPTYTFGTLPAGGYTVDVPATFSSNTLSASTPTGTSVTLAAGEHRTGIDFLYEPPAPLTITCLAPGTGQVGTPYTGSATASGGVAPYTYAVVGTLPAGLTLNSATGAISGTPTAPGSFTVKVTDSQGTPATATSTCSVTIAPAPLTISCVSPGTGQVGVPYTGSATASGGVAPYTYAVVGTLPAGLTLDSATGAISGTPTAPGSFTVKVTDSQGTPATATSTCSVTIAPAPLTISCVSPGTGQVGVPYTGSATASGGVAPYTYAVVGTLPAGLTLNSATGAISGTPTAPGSFTVKVTDAQGTPATATSSCSVTIAPAPLTISCVSPGTGQVGTPYTGSATASGGVAPYTYTIVGSLPAGLTMNTSTGAITGTPTAPGSFTVKVTDAQGTPATATSTCNVTIAPAPLTISCVSPGTGQVGTPYTGSATASGGVAPYTYAVVGTLPAGLSFNSATGAISGTPTAPGSFTVKVTDAQGTPATATSTCSVTIAPAPLTISCVSPGTGQVGTPYTGSATASGGVAPYTYAVVGTLPAGLTLNSATGAISGTPTAPGSFTVKVTDAQGTPATATSTCSVTIAPAPLTISCVSPGTGQVGTPYNGSATASGGVAPYTYAVVGTLPAGLTLNSATGAISGTPTAPGSFTVKVTDAQGTPATATSTCSVTIAPAPLTIACVSPGTGQVGTPYTGSATASGGVAPYTYAVVGTLPAGLSLNSATGAISGTPTAPGSFTVKVTDSQGTPATATSTCSVTIAPAPLTISCVSPGTGQVGTPYNGSATASGGVAPYTYAVVGTLPAGLTLNSATGAISGTPTAAGSFTVKVTDSQGTPATATSTCNVTIAPAPLTISCVSPGTGQVGTPYTGSATASGGVAPYTYAVVGTLPAGLTLNSATGAISGTPTAPGSFTVKVTDSQGIPATATSTCSVTIAPAPLTISCVSPGTGQVGTPYNGSATASGGVAPYTYAVVGTLPAGLTLNSATGAISGTPTAAGSFTVKVTDAQGTPATATSTCSVTIAPAPLTISCVSPGTGQVGTPYNGSATASGGVAPYTYAVVGTLPAGLTLNSATGAISGTPTAAGSFTVKVTDAQGTPATATSSCSVTIASAPTGGAYVTVTQGGWGAPPSGNNPGMILKNNFVSVYPNGVTIGGTPYYLKFTSAAAIEAFLPAGGKPGVLNKSATNPTSSSANVLAGQVLALQLSVDFSKAGITTAGLSVLKIASGYPLAGQTVTQVLTLANQVLAGNTSALPSGMSVSNLNDLVTAMNQNFDNGTTNNGMLVH